MIWRFSLFDCYRLGSFGFFNMVYIIWYFWWICEKILKLVRLKLCLCVDLNEVLLMWVRLIIYIYLCYY